MVTGSGDIWWEYFDTTAGIIAYIDFKGLLH